MKPFTIIQSSVGMIDCLVLDCDDNGSSPTDCPLVRMDLVYQLFSDDSSSDRSDLDRTGARLSQRPCPLGRLVRHLPVS